MYKYVFVFFASFALSNLFFSRCAHAETFKADPTRTLYVVGEVTGQTALANAATLINLSATSDDDDIDIVINSPGGSIYDGMQMLSAMSVAQARGVKIRCFVPMLAASMAYQIFAACNERYTLVFSLLLWHPGKISNEKPMSSQALAYSQKELKAIETDLNTRLMDAMDVDARFFYYHYWHETLWFAAELNRQVPDFITIVDDFTGVKGAFDAGQ